ncbi:hypothetical protein [Sulfitobacter donghicola]|uniref:Uncharacterized protein n=1 Tax=Sulfitobacter donghicola DSW-25 = KCTC 12864 = JCM 14565 TaxID=1300350 RepID=A0A073IY49_9RHOB|nr:hypothetical protein [Sulfitobacter donghicola]KEJ90317.1 hypothetical protein DSW25_07005 [Sulfitobacter donghicola DSW-25 = KCTC 12864 = JCM 14565]KIN66918.1 hypothetical protein Z948_622 [Sulfitobacter donghicola DSW-25 = KCTC 12864 = JCM 14565]
MKKQVISLALVAGIAACSGGNPFEEAAVVDENTTDGETVGDGEGTGIDRDGIPPGTVSPSPGDALFRSEPTVDGDGVDQGNGTANGFQYNSEDDTFTVDNLAFDGDRPYDRGTLVSSLNNGEFAVYEAPVSATDPVNNQTINQLGYRLVYGVSRNRIANSDGTASDAPTTQFAIVRTGSYIDYGFGGFIYQRDNGVSLPDTLQATFSGRSAGLRDASNAGGLQYTTADVTVDIDFDDFNDGTTIRGDGVKGRIYNRRIIDLDGTDITASVAGTLGEDNTTIPDAVFTVGPDVLDDNGDLITDIQSQLPDGTIYEEGKFYAIVAGDNPDEIVGVFVLEAQGQDITSRDTGGFIVYRDADVQP